MPFLLQLLDQIPDTCARFAIHGYAGLEVPLYHESPVSVDVHVTWRMVTLPGDEYIATSSNLSHEIVPQMVTLSKRSPLGASGFGSYREHQLYTSFL